MAQAFPGRDHAEAPLLVDLALQGAMVLADGHAQGWRDAFLAENCNALGRRSTLDIELLHNV
jgi:hypothetical protein